MITIEWRMNAVSTMDLTVSIDDRRGRGPFQSSGPFPRDRELDGEPTRLKTKYKTKLPTNPTLLPINERYNAEHRHSHRLH
jgi:hypothetical protein